MLSRAFVRREAIETPAEFDESVTLRYIDVLNRENARIMYLGKGDKGNMMVHAILASRFAPVTCRDSRALKIVVTSSENRMKSTVQVK